MPEIDKVAFLNAIEAILSDGDEDFSNELLTLYHLCVQEEIKHGLSIQKVEVPEETKIKLDQALIPHIKKRDQLKYTLAFLFQT